MIVSTARQNPDPPPRRGPRREAARREDSRAGKLKIFVGAAPGVGKTYEMLQSAHARLKAGADVVVGVVETHGRAETEALLKGLEVLPRKRLGYKDQTLEEMDLDALIARRPQIALVDELAHTNVSGSRHPKRYLDVEELLTHGIDVRDFVERKRDAMAMHVSQTRSGSADDRTLALLLRLPRPVARVVLGREWFAERGAPETTLLEPDLFVPAGTWL